MEGKLIPTLAELRCRRRVRTWASSVQAMVPGGGGGRGSRPEPLPTPTGPDADLSDPLLSLCSNVQVIAAQLHESDRLEAAITRARRLRSVQDRALSLAHRLGLL